MGKFRDYLESLIIERHILNEMPQVFDLDLNPTYVDKELMSYIQQGINNKTAEYIDDVESLYLFSAPINKFDRVYFLSDNNQVVGATRVSAINLGTGSYYQAKITKKIKDSTPNRLVKLYRAISINAGTYIVTDNIQTISSSTVWRKMFNSPNKYGIADIKVFNKNKEVKLSSELDIWGATEDKADKIVAVKFK